MKALHSHRIIPYEMLHEAVITAQELILTAVPENEFVVLKSFLRNIKPALQQTIDKAKEGCPVVAHHYFTFSFHD